MGLIRDGRQMAWPFTEMRKAGKLPNYMLDGKRLTVEYDDKNKAARVLDESGNEVPTVTAFWFAWYAFHPETDVFEAGK